MQDSSLRLVIFDVDGTLVDSQAFILEAMRAAFDRAGHEAPSREEALGIVGLSLPQAMATLAPGAGISGQARLVEYYKEAFLTLREQTGGEAGAPLYPGADQTIRRLDAAGFLMSIATGKARRGLEHFLESHRLGDYFLGTQCADDAPSKPHPQMVLNCLAATGVAPENAAIVGDTEFDMAMGRAAGVRTIGVDWGYHPRERVRRGGAEAIVRDFDELEALIGDLWAMP